MTPADELRAAADKLRALAEAAASDSGSTTWRAARHFPEQPNSSFTALWAVGARPLLRGGERGRPPAYVMAPVGDYIATMDPGVGLALADWLDDAARAYEAAVAGVAEVYGKGTDAARAFVTTGPGVQPRALAVARVINQEQS